MDNKEESVEEFKQRARQRRKYVQCDMKVSSTGFKFSTKKSTLIPVSKSNDEVQSSTSHREAAAEFSAAKAPKFSEPSESHTPDLTIEPPSEMPESAHATSRVLKPIASNVNYRLCLSREQDGVVVINSQMIAIAEYHASKGAIDCTDYRVIIQRRGSHYCSCQKTQAHMLSETQPWVTWHSAQPCVHLNVLHESGNLPVLEDWFNDDEHHTYSAQTEHESKVYPVNDWSTVVYDSKSRCFGCVFVHAGSIRCRCSSHRGHCTYISLFKAAMESQEEFGALSANLHSHQNIIIKERTSVSWSSIDLATPRLHTPKEGTVLKLTCRDCGGEQFDMPSEQRLVCYDEQSSFYILARKGYCCGSSQQCDGIEAGVLNMGDYAVSHRLLRGYLKLFVSDGLPLHSFHKKLYWTYLENGVQSSGYMTYHLLRMAWMAFSRLLSLGNFSCPDCGPNPPVVVCDGLTLSFRKKYRLDPIVSENTATSEKLSGCSHSKLLLIENRQYRKRLHDAMDNEDVEEEEVVQLRNLAQTFAPFLLPALGWFIEIKKIPRHWRRLVRDVCKSSPICGFAQCSVSDFNKIIDHIKSKKIFAEDLDEVCQICPPIYSFLLHSSHDEMIHLKPVLDKVLEVLQYVQEQRAHSLPAASEPPCELSSGCFPDLPIIRQRGKYTMDTKKDSDSCRKLMRGHKSLLPGIFLLHCQHGICYGFHVMDNNESPDVPFTVITTRFEQAPRLIVYDNACNLHTYALNRNPGFFINTRFLVDRFHWNNHVACSSGYCVDGYPQFSSLNTQLAEQRNSTLVRLKASLSYQHQENFFQSMKVFLSFRNTLKVLMIRKPENDSEKVIAQLSKLYK